MAFAQLANKRSLRDTIFAPNHVEFKLYPMGIRSVSRNNLSNALRQRDWEIFADLGAILMEKAQYLYRKESCDCDFENEVFALDSTTIDLCLSLFPWADFRSTKAGIKVHTLLNLRTEIPHCIRISTANIHDVNILDEMTFLKNSWYIMDRGYMDFRRPYWIQNAKFRRIYSHPVDKTTGLRGDQTVRPDREKSRESYPEKLRRVKFYDREHARSLVFLTNDFAQSAK